MRNRVTVVCADARDAGLLTVRADAALRAARVVVADPDLEDVVRAVTDAEVVVLTPDLSLARRTRVVRDACAAGPGVVRVLGADAVCDGSLAQELQALSAHAQLEVVPAVTGSALAATYAGVSFTGQRTRGFRVIDAVDPSADWSMRPRELLIVRNGAVVPDLLGSLTDAGWAEGTPYRLVSNAATLRQRTSTGVLGDGSVPEVAIDAVLLVGEPVRDAVDWFERLPLFGWRLLVPRTKDPLADLTHALEREGAAVTHVNTLSVEPPRTPQQMERAVAGLAEGRYGWVALTCANAFTAVWEKCLAYGLDARAFAGTRIAAVGEDTLEILASHGLRADLVPAGGTTQDLLECFPDGGEEYANRVLIPRAEIATETLTEGVTALGWEVDEVTAFRTVRAAPPVAPTREAIKGGGFDAVVFTSSATVRNLIGLAGKPNARTVVACIGPGTARTAEEHGLRVDVVALEATHASILEALVEHALAVRAEPEEPVIAPRSAAGGTRRKAK